MDLSNFFNFREFKKTALNCSYKKLTNWLENGILNRNTVFYFNAYKIHNTFIFWTEVSYLFLLNSILFSSICIFMLCMSCKFMSCKFTGKVNQTLF